MREKQSAKRAFRAKAKWFEQGEKSNKYFMNLNKRYKKQKVIESIVCDDITYSGQDRVASGIVGFYKKLYSSSNSIEVGDEDDDFYEQCPRLSDQSREMMDSDITDLELLAALRSCGESCPGSNGIPYSVFKKLWVMVGPYICMKPLGCCW